MANMVTPLADGGRVESWTDSSQIHLQKYDASGAKVGGQIDAQAQNFTPQVVALSNGGFAVSTGYVFKGGTYNIAVYDPTAALTATIDVPGAGIGFQLAASPEGGFLLVSEDLHYDSSGGSGGYDYSWRPLLTTYDNSGQVTHATVPLAGTLPTVSVLADGHYQVQWQDGDIAHSLNIDPQHLPTLAKPAAPTLTLIDDQGAHTGVISGSTTDPTPIARIAVSQQGWVEVQQVFDTGTATEHQIAGGVQVTAADVARGYIDVPMSGGPTDGPYTFFARFKTADGVVSEATTQHINIYKVAEIWSVTDDAGAHQGVLADGATTDDTTPVVRIGLESSGLHAGDDLVLRDQGAEVARVTLTGADAARGYVDVTTSVLAQGDHVLNVTGTPATPGFHLTVAADASQSSGSGAGRDITSPGPGSTVSGTAGADTIHASQGPDVITTGAGADVVAFGALPWNAGHVTDFVVGTDKLDLSAIFSASGYAGSDPVADGRMTLQADGAGGTQVYFDRDAANSGDWPFLVTTLDHVSASGLTWAQLSGSAGAPPTSPPPPPPPPPPSSAGQNITSPAPGSTVTGTGGNDTIHASQGPDVITTGAGADVVAFGALPWNAGHITDFAVGTDKLDFSAIFQASGYMGSDPVADGRMSFQADGAGGTQVYFDHDQPNGGDWPFLITTLDHVAASGLTWSQLSAGGSAPTSPPPPPPSSGGTQGQVITSPGPGSTLTGGNGDDTLNASRGPDVLTGGVGDDVFAWRDLPWRNATVTDFNAGHDKLDLRPLFAASHYTGSDPVADHWLEFRDDGQGDTGVYFDPDGPGTGEWPFFITSLQHVAPSQIGPGDFLFH